ncbi:MAG: sn-glycerol-3-phosphate ABC transporter ATP-binding protein UgpC [Pseudomonadota bacterium]
MAEVTLTNIAKAYGNLNVIENLNLAIADKEFVVLVGPSGCGKTTTLRMIAGLETVSSGQVMIGERDVTYLRPGSRDCAMVFQNYALYPHMSVADNIAYGMKVRGVPKGERDAAIGNAARILGLDAYLDRRPKQLSGGQRQRVAIARAIVRDPKVFLFDEPLSNLDAKLRIETRAEIKALHRRLETTIVYVTHDQVEAMTLADRVVVMHDGRIEQAADPITLYDRPANTFVATFIGAPSMNLLPVTVDRQNGDARLRLETGETLTPLPEQANHLGADGETLILGIRPENLTDERTLVAGAAPADERWSSATMTVETVEPLGPHTLALGAVGEKGVTAQIDAHRHVAIGDQVSLQFDMARIHMFDATSKKRIG